MDWVRTGRVARIVAVFFLLWTAVDLTIPSMCAMEQQPESNRTAATVLTAAQSPQSAPNGSAEDCFCCCHHLVSTAAWVPVTQSDVAQLVTALSVEHVRVFHTHLDHPPRFV